MKLHGNPKRATAVCVVTFFLIQCSKEAPPQVQPAAQVKTEQGAAVKYCKKTQLILPERCTTNPRLLNEDSGGIYTTYLVTIDPLSETMCTWACMTERQRRGFSYADGPWTLFNASLFTDPGQGFFLFHIASAPEAPAKLLSIVFDTHRNFRDALISNVSTKNIVEYRLGWIYQRNSQSTIGSAYSADLAPGAQDHTGRHAVPTDIYGDDAGTATFFVAYVKFADGSNWQVKTIDEIKRMVEPIGTSYLTQARE